MKDMKTLETCDERSKRRVNKKLAEICIDHMIIKGKAKNIIEKAERFSNQYYAYIFGGEEPLTGLMVIEEILAKVPGKHEVVTPAEKKYWWNATQESWKLLDKVTVLRNSVSDEYNNTSLGIEALSTDDYMEMPAELKEKIIFQVNPKVSDMKTMEDVLTFIKWANELGVKKVVFVDNKHSQEWENYQNARKEILRKEYSARNKQIEALRNNSFDLEKANIKKHTVVQKPLLLEVAEELMKKGYHFKAQKAERNKSGFYDIRELICGNSEVGFKYKIKHADLVDTVVFRDVYAL